MNEAISQLLSYVPALWRRRWVVVGVAWIICLGGWATVAMVPDRYESSAKVYVDTDSLLRPLLKGIAVDTNPLREVQIMQRTLISRPNLEKVARMTDLDLAVKTSEENERLLAGLEDDIRITSDRRGTSLFQIKYTHSEPQTAQRVVQALLTIFVEGNLGASRKEMDAARQFLDEQLRKYEEQMNAAEERITRFKQQYMGLMPGDADYYDRLTQSRSTLEALRNELDDSKTRANELQRQLQSVPEVIETIGAAGLGGPPSGVEVRILELETAIDNLLLRYTDNHPDVVAARARVEQLREELQQEQEFSPFADDMEEQGSGPGSEVPTQTQPNPLHAQIKMQVVDSQAKVATLENQVKRQEDQVSELLEQANRVPEVEAELKRLNRDYGVIRKNYEQLLSRKEAATISESRESKGEKVQFRIVEPPRLPLLPTGVKRSLYLTLVLIAGVGAGIGLGGLIVTQQTTFFGAQQLMQSVALPVIGSVSAILPPGRRTWRAVNLASFFAVCFGLLGTYGGLVTIERQVGLPRVIPADFKEQVMERLPADVTEMLK